VEGPKDLIPGIDTFQFVFRIGATELKELVMVSSMEWSLYVGINVGGSGKVVLTSVC
jgi:hypothetical protein